MRTRLNVRDSDGTVIFSNGPLHGGSQLTAEAAAERGRPWLHLDLEKLDDAVAALRLRGWILAGKISILNVAGPRASHDPRIYACVRRVLRLVFEAPD